MFQCEIIKELNNFDELFVLINPYNFFSKLKQIIASSFLMTTEFFYSSFSLAILMQFKTRLTKNFFPLNTNQLNKHFN